MSDTSTGATTRSDRTARDPVLTGGPRVARIPVRDGFGDGSRTRRTGAGPARYGPVPAAVVGVTA
jgi:hypothetical protein